MKTNHPTPQAPDQLKALGGLTKYALISALRNRGSLFFSLIFPIAFILIFGFLGDTTSPLKIGVTPDVDRNNPVYIQLKTLAEKDGSSIQLSEGSKIDLENELGKNNLGAVVEPASNPSRSATDLSLATSNSNPQSAATARSILASITGALNLQAAHVTTPAFIVEPGPEVSGRTYRYIDFLIPGQIGFSLLSLATFGVAFSFITLRRTLVFKRLLATSVTPLTFVISQCISRSVQGLVQTAIIILVGVLAFHFTLPHGWISFVNMMILSVIGIFAFLGFGILVSNIAKDEQSAPIALNLFNFPQMLLSGTFFPSDGFPHWLRLISNNLPLSYLNIGMRKITTEGQSILEIWPYILGLIAWSLVAYFFAARTFKAE